MFRVHARSLAANRRLTTGRENRDSYVTCADIAAVPKSRVRCRTREQKEPTCPAAREPNKHEARGRAIVAGHEPVSSRPTAMPEHDRPARGARYTTSPPPSHAFATRKPNHTGNWPRSRQTHGYTRRAFDVGIEADQGSTSAEDAAVELLADVDDHDEQREHLALVRSAFVPRGCRADLRMSTHEMPDQQAAERPTTSTRA